MTAHDRLAALPGYLNGYDAETEADQRHAYDVGFSDAMRERTRRSPPQDLGSRVVDVTPEIGLACMARDSRAALDLAMARWRSHPRNAGEHVPDDPIYSFAYWLFRWSGIVTGVNLDAPEHPWAEATADPAGATPSAEGAPASAPPDRLPERRPDEPWP